VPIRTSPAASPRWRSAIPALRVPMRYRQQRTRLVWHETYMLASIYGRAQSINSCISPTSVRLTEYEGEGDNEELFTGVVVDV
jgi:hypothetical protein